MKGYLFVRKRNVKGKLLGYDNHQTRLIANTQYVYGNV